MSTIVLSGMAAKIAAEAGKILMKDPSAITDFNAKSLVEFTQSTRVEPICAVDTRLTGYDFTTDVMKMLNSRYAGMYLAAGSLVGDIGGIKTVKALDKINTSRNVGLNIASTILSNVSTADIETDIHVEEVEPEEQFIPQLPVYKDTTESAMFVFSDASMEALQINPNGQPIIPEAGPGSVTTQAVDMNLISNLSVGQQVILTISDGKASREIPVNIRLIAYPTDPKTLSTILRWSERDNSAKARFRAWRAGELTGWRDTIFMRDVFVERYRALINDKTGLFQAMTSRVNKNILAGVISMTPSVGTISSIAVVSEDTVRDLEDRIDGKLSDYNVRQRIMNTTGLMIIAVVDPITELVTVYTYTQQIPEEYSIKQIKTASKNSGGDISEIIKLLNPTATGRSF